MKIIDVVVGGPKNPTKAPAPANVLWAQQSSPRSLVWPHQNSHGIAGHLQSNIPPGDSSSSRFLILERRFHEISIALNDVDPIPVDNALTLRMCSLPNTPRFSTPNPKFIGVETQIPSPTFKQKLGYRNWRFRGSSLASNRIPVISAILKSLPSREFAASHSFDPPHPYRKERQRPDGNETQG